MCWVGKVLESNRRSKKEMGGRTKKGEMESKRGEEGREGKEGGRKLFLY